MTFTCERCGASSANPDDLQSCCAPGRRWAGPGAAPRPCRECGHEHLPASWGFICVGCPCPVRSIGVPVQANADMYPDAGERLAGWDKRRRRGDL